MEIAWAIVGTVVSILLGAAMNLVGFTPPEFRAARRCFLISALLLGGTEIVWQAQTDKPLWVRLLIGVSIWGVIGAGLPEGFRWVAEREKLFSTMRPQPNIDHEGRLKLVFDSSHRVQQGELIQYFITVKNNDRTPVDKATVIIDDMVSLTDSLIKAGMNTALAKLKGRSLMLKDEMYKQNELPKKEFYIFGNSDIDLVIMEAQVSHPWIFLRHAEYEWSSAKTSNNLIARKPVKPSELPAGDYRLSLLLRGSDGSSERKTFIATLDSKHFELKETTPKE